MKTLSLAAAAVLFAGAAFAADPVEGMWKTKPDDNGNYGYVQIAPCGAKLCGVLVKAFDPNGAEKPSENVGKQIVWDMVANGDGSYGNGKVWAPDRDKTYKSKMQLSGDNLSVSGCVLGGVICRASDWSRVK
ncbi:MAG: imidazoleglycerol-phosphate dehydratase [Rhodobacterales bacterium 32-67-9]|nr:MAG: imidazoleglycerol-phosphate dehydratase [Rhodobacterales bacterium 32-67-9]